MPKKLKNISQRARFCAFFAIIALGVAGMAAQSFSQSPDDDVRSPMARIGSFTGLSRHMNVSLVHVFEEGAFEKVSASTLNLTSQAVRQFYAMRGDQPYWLDAGGALRVQGQGLIKTLADSWQHGFDPAMYHVQEIAVLMQSNQYKDRARAEILMTDGFARYARDLSGMRVGAERLNLLADNWRQALDAGLILTKLEETYDFQRVLQSVMPASASYDRLRAAYVALMQEPAGAYESILPIKFSKLLMPGMRDKRVPDLRLRMGTPALSADATLYDDALAAAVMAFQRDSGLESDGAVGERTLQLLNLSRAQKIERLLANMERLRWVKPDGAARKIIVNVPSASLWAIDNGQVSFEMPVIVGRPGRPTHSFIAQIEGVRLNPNWTVPPVIKRSDFLPKLKEDPQFLASKGIKLVREGKPLDPQTVDWENVTRQELHAMKMVQGPGDDNALGRYRVLMPNPHNIYLHDTNHKSAFDAPERAVSSGCIRLSDPRKVADFLLQGETGWDAARIDAVVAGGKTRDVKIANSVSVHINYYTAWVGADGEVVYGNDIYGFDKKLLELLPNLAPKSETDTSPRV